MKTYPLNEARAEFSKLVERALSGEPQRVTRYGKESVIIISEADWRARTRAAPSLGHLLAQYAEITQAAQSGDGADHTALGHTRRKAASRRI